MGIGIAACASHRCKTKGGCLTRQDLLNFIDDDSGILSLDSLGRDVWRPH